MCLQLSHAALQDAHSLGRMYMIPIQSIMAPSQQPYTVTRLSSNEIRFGPAHSRKSAEYFLNLPTNIKNQIFGHLPYQSLVNLRSTHRNFTSAAEQVLDQRPEFSRTSSNSSSNSSSASVALCVRRGQQELSISFA